MLRSVRAFITVVALITAPFCPVQAQLPAVSQQTASTSASQPAAGDVPTTSSNMSDYKLGVADHVRMTVYNEPDLSGDFTVNANGVLSLPLIGDVQAQGLTGSQIVDIVQKKLADGYLRDPKVALEVLSYRPFYILGEVTKPGEYPYSNGLTVLNAVATAQGYTYRANKKRVFIKHAGSSTEENLKVSPDLQVQPGDTIRIGERYF